MNGAKLSLQLGQISTNGFHQVVEDMKLLYIQCAFVCSSSLRRVVLIPDLEQNFFSENVYVEKNFSQVPPEKKKKYENSRKSLNITYIRSELFFIIYCKNIYTFFLIIKLKNLKKPLRGQDIWVKNLL
jgi:hypothetical protein